MIEENDVIVHSIFNVMVKIMTTMAILMLLCGCTRNNHTQNNGNSNYNDRITIDVLEANENGKYYAEHEYGVSDIWAATSFQNKLYAVINSDNFFDVVEVFDDGSTVNLYTTSAETPLWISSTAKNLYILSFGADGMYYIKVLDLNSSTITSSSTLTSIDGDDTRDFQVDAQGNMYFLQNTRIEVISNKGTYLGTIDFQGGTSQVGICRTESGQILACSNQSDGIYIDSISTTDLCVKPSYKISTTTGKLLSGFGKYLFCLNQDGVLYGLDSVSGEPTEIANLSNSNISSNNIWLLKETNTDELLYIKDGVLYSLIQSASVQIPKHTNLSIATSSDFANISWYISEYEKEHPEYSINQCVYSDTNAQLQLRLQLLAGDGPDMIDFMGIDLVPYEAKQMLENLYSYIDSDSELVREDFNCLNPLEYNGSLFVLPTTYSLNTYAISSNLIGERDTWGYSDFCKIQNLSSDDPILTNTYAQGFLNNSIENIIAKSVNYDTNTCDFSNGFLAQVLNAAKLLPISNSGEMYYDSSDISPMMQVSFFSINDYVQFKEDYPNYKIIGWPSFNGENTTRINYSSTIAICTTSANKEAAWNFIKYAVCKAPYSDTQLYVYRPYYEQVVQNGLNPSDPFEGMEIIEGENGGFYANGVFYDGEYSKPEPVFTTKDVTEFDALTTSITSFENYDYAIAQIILEESEYFFHDEKSIAEVEQIIQNRASIYLSEQS